MKGDTYMKNDEQTPIVRPVAEYLSCADVPRWLKENQNIVIFHIVYTREMKVLIFYRPLSEVSNAVLNTLT
jgi:hypothetical protein